MTLREPRYNKRRKQWHPTPVLFPGKSHGRRSLVGYSPSGRYEWTRLSDFTFTFHFHTLEKEMATHSSVLALRIPGTGEPGGLPSMGSHRVGHDWSDLAAAVAGIIKVFHLMSITKDMLILIQPNKLWEKKWPTYASILAWRIPWTGEPGGL